MRLEREALEPMNLALYTTIIKYMIGRRWCPLLGIAS